jgi:prepilin-type N-terminal cleavage/methylation domain-containing protein
VDNFDQSSSYRFWYNIKERSDKLVHMKHKGFTLLEILLVIAAIGVLAAIVIIAINPQRQLAQVRDASRESGVQSLQKALDQYNIDNGEYPMVIGVDYRPICREGQSGNCIDLASALVPTYIAAIPEDYNVTNESAGFQVAINADNSRIAVKADNTEIAQEVIAVNDVTYPATVGEAGRFTSSNSNPSGTWETINFTNTYIDPIVLGAANSDDSQEEALNFQVQNITNSSAQMRLCRTSDILDECGNHTNEIAGYVVIDLAMIDLYEGIEAGRLTDVSENVNSGGWLTHSFTKNFEDISNNPKVFIIPQEVLGGFPLEAKVRNVTESSFQVGVCYTGNNDDNCQSYPDTDVAYLAIDTNNIPFVQLVQMGTESEKDDNWSSFTFSSPFLSIPIMIAENQTDNGAQNVEINELRNITNSGGQIRFCEVDFNSSTDGCDNHNSERQAWAAFTEGTLTIEQ